MLDRNSKTHKLGLEKSTSNKDTETLRNQQKKTKRTKLSIYINKS